MLSVAAKKITKSEELSEKATVKTKNRHYGVKSFGFNQYVSYTIAFGNFFFFFSSKLPCASYGGKHIKPSVLVMLSDGSVTVLH